MKHGVRGIVLAFSLTALVTVSHAQESALLFDGIDDVAITGSPMSWPSGTSALTVEAWINPFDVSGVLFRGIAENGVGFWFTLQSYDNSVVTLTISNGPTSSASTPGGSAVVGRWDHFAGTYDGVTMRVYHNGELVAENDHVSGGPIGLAYPVIIGLRGGAGTFPGVIDEVRIWNVVRTEGEIRTWMGRPLTGSEPGLLGYWRFNEGAGQVITDTTAYGVDGVLGSTPASESDDPQWTNQVPPVAFFFDGFESGNTDAWSSVTP